MAAIKILESTLEVKTKEIESWKRHAGELQEMAKLTESESAKRIKDLTELSEKFTKEMQRTLNAELEAVEKK